MNIDSKEFLAWTAGFFDGEGCVNVERVKHPRCNGGYSLTLNLTITQVDRMPLEFIKSKFGGRIHKKANKKNPNASHCHFLRFNNAEALVLLKAIQPYCIAKLSQVNTALEFPFDENNKFCTNHPMPEDVRNKRNYIYTRLREIKQDIKVASL